MKRTQTAKSVLAAVALAGLAAGQVSATVLVQETFDALNGNLSGMLSSTNSIGLDGPGWIANANSQNALNSLMVANNFNVDSGVTNAKPFQISPGNDNRGGVWWNAGSWDVGSWAARPLVSGSMLNMGADGTYYVAFNLTYKSDDSLGFGFATGATDASAFISCGPNWNNTSFNSNASAKRLAVAVGSPLSAWPGVSGASAYSSAVFVNNLNYTVLVKITASASGSDNIKAAFFTASRAGYGLLPPDESTIAWDVNYTFTDSNLYSHLLAYINGGTYYANLDAFRMGTAYADVVQIEPLITTQPVPSPAATVYAGVPVTMSVATTGGLPAPQYFQWWKGTMTVPDGTNATLTLTNPAVADSGAYYVVVTNAFGKVTSVTNTITILPANPPILTAEIQPVNPSRMIGGKAVFSAGLDGTPPFTYQWTHAGTNLPAGTNLTLTLPNVSLADAGTYTLYITNAFGWTNTATSTLTVLTPAAGSYAEKIVTNRPIAYWRLNEGVEYSQVDTTSEYMGGYDATHTNVTAAPSIRPPAQLGMETDNLGAYYNGTAATVTRASIMNNLGQFTLMGWFNPSTWPQSSQSGSARVALFGQNDVAEFGCHSAGTIGIWTPGGGYVEFNASTLVSSGNWYFITAVADGTKVTFYLNGNQTGSYSQSTTNYGSSSYPFRIGYGVLDAGGNEFQGTIDEVALFDRALGVEEVNAIYAKAIGVAQPPGILQDPVGGTRYVSQNFTLSVTASGTLPLKYQWRQNEAPIFGATNTQLVLSNLTAAAAGGYDVVVTNIAGGITSGVAALTIIAPAAGSYESQVIALNPAGYWRLNEPAGSTVAADYWGGRNGTYELGAVAGLAGVTNPPPLPGFESTNLAVQTINGNASSWVSLPGLGFNTNTVTLTCWMYADGDQGGWRGILYNRNWPPVAGLHFGNGNELRYTWNDQNWGWDSTLQVPTNQWVFAALVVQPDQATIYLGADRKLASAVNSATHPNQNFNTSTRIGNDRQDETARTFNGLVDEVAIYPRALTPQEIGTLFNAGAGNVELKIARSGDKVILSWPAGMLQSASEITGTFDDLPTATSPYTNSTSASRQYFRVKLQ